MVSADDTLAHLGEHVVGQADGSNGSATTVASGRATRTAAAWEADRSMHTWLIALRHKGSCANSQSGGALQVRPSTCASSPSVPAASANPGVPPVGPPPSPGSRVAGPRPAGLAGSHRFQGSSLDRVDGG